MLRSDFADARASEAELAHFSGTAAQAPAAIILAAGAGSRLRGDDAFAPPKPLQPVAGVPLIQRTLSTFAQAGVREAVVVLGCEFDRIRAGIDEIADAVDIDVTITRNHRWERGNSTSVLAAAEHVGDRFFLAMSDHLFEPTFLDLLQEADQGAALSLIVDRHWEAVPDVDEATKVRLEENQIVDIGKEIPVFDAVDTGVFLCRPALFEAVRITQQSGDFTLSGAVQHLIPQGDAIAVPSHGLFWQDIDTPEDLALAEQRLAALDELGGDWPLHATPDRAAIASRGAPPIP